MNINYFNKKSMINYGIRKYAFIPANDKLFDLSLKLAKFVLYRYLRNRWFNNKKSNQINETERAKSFKDYNYDAKELNAKNAQEIMNEYCK